MNAWSTSSLFQLKINCKLLDTQRTMLLLAGIGTVWLTRRVVGRCEGHLRDWYDRNQGTQPTAV